MSDSRHPSLDGCRNFSTANTSEPDPHSRMTRRVVLSWSSGKDSAWTLYQLQKMPDVEIVGLMTTVNVTHNRVAMHATRRVLLEAQAAAIGLPLHVIALPWPCSNNVYEAALRDALAMARQQGATHIAFGDIFLSDIRSYREQQLVGTGLEPMFPIWGTPTDQLALRIIDAGVDAVLTCVDPQKMPVTFAGRWYNRQLLHALPREVDPCGENGEFHSCVVAGPMFRHRIPVVVGEIITRDHFCFADVMPTNP